MLLPLRTSIEYVEFANGLPDHLISIPGLIIGHGSQPKHFQATVKANMYIEGFVESFANALGLDEYVSKLLDYDSICGNGVKNLLWLHRTARLQ